MRKREKQKELENIVNEPIVNKPIGIIQLKMVRESRSLYGADPFTSPAKAVELIKPLLITADREMVLVMSLTAKMEALAVEIVAVGGLDLNWQGKAENFWISLWDIMEMNWNPTICWDYATVFMYINGCCIYKEKMNFNMIKSKKTR